MWPNHVSSLSWIKSLCCPHVFFFVLSTSINLWYTFPSPIPYGHQVFRTSNQVDHVDVTHCQSILVVSVDVPHYPSLFPWTLCTCRCCTYQWSAQLSTSIALSFLSPPVIHPPSSSQAITWFGFLECGTPLAYLWIHHVLFCSTTCTM